VRHSYLGESTYPTTPLYAASRKHRLLVRAGKIFIQCNIHLDAGLTLQRCWCPTNVCAPVTVIVMRESSSVLRNPLTRRFDVFWLRDPGRRSLDFRDENRSEDSASQADCRNGYYSAWTGLRLAEGLLEPSSAAWRRYLRPRILFGCRSWSFDRLCEQASPAACGTTAVFTGPYNQSYQNQRPLRQFCVF
jgi:hypothetical protein